MFSERRTSVELALREALNNAILHGNRLDVSKLVHVRCCCERGKGVHLTVRDAGHGFDPDKIPDPLASENLPADHGRGIHLMKWAMDEVSFDRAGTECTCAKHHRVSQKLSPGVPRTELLNGLSDLRWDVCVVALRRCHFARGASRMSNQPEI